ncbi:MAG TPA: hypothetical protein VMR25_15340, partial [Planctomycetaceae bacterium]|nr:hypothetical protein [Planctomycetaceae bacterium]
MDENRAKQSESNLAVAMSPSIAAGNLPQPAWERRSMQVEEDRSPHEKAKILLVDDRPANLP